MLVMQFYNMPLLYSQKLKKELICKTGILLCIGYGKFTSRQMAMTRFLLSQKGMKKE